MADNPGPTLFHCHPQDDEDEGSMGLIDVRLRRAAQHSCSTEQHQIFSVDARGWSAISIRGGSGLLGRAYFLKPDQQQDIIDALD